MKTNEIEIKTGLSKQTILYYEKEGLINPERNENGYRNYSDENLQQLMLIKLLRSMNVSIDDIKLVFSHQLSVDECLQVQEQFNEEAIKSIKEVQSTTKFYKDKDLPLIPQLQEFSANKIKSKLGFRKTTDTVTIGRKLTKEYLIKKLLHSLVFSILIGMASYIGFSKWAPQLGKTEAFIVFILFFGIQIVSLVLGFGDMNNYFTQNNPTIFIEFGRDGIKFVSQDLLSRFTYMMSILKGEEKCNFMKYEDIVDVKINNVQRYMRIPGTSLPSTLNTYDYCFNFKDGKSYLLVAPMLLDQDRQIIETILKNKTKVVE